MKRKKAHTDLRCTQCKREMDPNWVRLLQSLLLGCIASAFKQMQQEHPAVLPKGWCGGLTKRAAGQFANKVWELERGLCGLRGHLDGERNVVYDAEDVFAELDGEFGTGPGLKG